MNRLDGRLAKIDADLAMGFAKVHGEISLLKWMLGAVMAGIVSLVLKTFFS